MDADWERLHAPEFWRWLFENDVSFEDERSFELALPCGSGRGLKVQIDEGTSVTLSDLETGTELGWIDDAHFHPNCLRADEALYVAEMQEGPQRGLATLLLLPFAVITTDGHANAIEAAAQRAWKAVGFEGSCSGLKIPEFREQKVEWYLDAKGRWCLRQAATDLSVRPLYTLRVEDNPEFPTWLSHIER